jgi:hypothetical protein
MQTSTYLHFRIGKINLKKTERLKMSEKTKCLKIVSLAVALVVIVQLTGCGYFLYPERRGQKPFGRVDPAIAVLDALGLLLFVLPGVIAFAVDITNGTLYFPGGHRHSSASTQPEQIMRVRVDPAKLSNERMEEILKNYAGVSIRLDQKKMEIYQLDGSENVEAELIDLAKSGYRKN